MRKIALPILVLFSFLNAHGTVLVALDIDNNFTTSIESGLTINRSSTGGGNLFVSGGTIARGAFDVRGVDANSLQGAIGNNNGASLLAGEIFTFISTITGNIFEAELTFYTRPNQNPLGEIPASLSAPLGTPPVGVPPVSAVLTVNQIPEPSAALLGSMAGLVVLLRRRR